MLGALCLTAAAPAAAIDGAALQKGRRGYWRVVLPDEMTKALRDSFPAFEVWPDSLYAKSVRSAFAYGESAAPFASIADLNGDGFEEVALDGHEKGVATVVLLVSKGNTYRALRALRMWWQVVTAPGGGVRLGPAGAARDSLPQPRAFTWQGPGSDTVYGFSWTDSTGIQRPRGSR